jgi:hypothetical protein
MPVCSRCHKDWPEQYWVCPEDGTVLTATTRTAVGNASHRTPVGLPREEDLLPGTMIGEYCVEGKLGEGGMASVFSATHPLIGKKVAIKVISRRLCGDQHAVERFIGEARSVNQIGHPNLVDVFAFGVLPDGRAYFVMEWLQGETLADRMARERLPVPRALDVLHQIVEALDAAHDKGVVHRDLKPHNVFLVERKDALRVKLLDFGIAKLADSDVSVPKTRSGVAMGTAGYMSPEQARGKNVDHRTDIYALGCLAYEILFGRLPFVADTAIDILAMHLAASPPPARSLWPAMPPALDKVLVQTLAKEPDGRPSLRQVRAVLEATARSIGPTMGVAPGPRARPERHWMRWIVGTGATAVVVGAGLYGYVTTRAQVRPLPSPIAAAVSSPAKDKELPVPAAPERATAAPEARSTILVRAPSGARVSVDGDDHVVLHGQPVKVEVPSGEHHVVVSAARHRPFSEHVRVAAGATVELRALIGGLPAVKKGGAAPAGAAPARAGETGEAKTPATASPAATAEKSADKTEKADKKDKKTGDYTLDPF